MDTWGPEKPTESNQHDDNRPGISGDQTTVRCGTDGNSSGARIQIMICRCLCDVQLILMTYTGYRLDSETTAVVFL